MIPQINPALIAKQPELFYDGVIVFIDDERKPTEKFTVRDFGLDCTMSHNGMTYANFIKFQVSGDKVSMLDEVNPGDKVRVHFSLRGQLKDQKEGTPTAAKNPNRKNIYTNPEAWRIEMIEKNVPVAQDAQNAAAPASAPAGAPVSTDDLPF